MHTKAAALWLALAASSLAKPAQLQERYVQCADSCYSQVRKNQLLGYQSKPGCKQLYEQTVTPCTVTSTSSVEWKGYPYAYRPCGPSVVTKRVDVTKSDVTTTTTPITIIKREPTPVANPRCTPTTRSTTTVPTYFPSCRNLGQYWSACDCLGQTQSVITRPTPTTTVTHIGCVTNTITSYTTVATTYTSTETDTSTIVQPYCSATITAYKDDGSQKVYKLNYHGSGKVTDPDADRYNQDDKHGAIVSYIDEASNDCDAIQQCANLAINRADEYYMFDVHYQDEQWYCYQYYQGTGDASNFSVDDPTVRKAYGYEIAYYQ